MREEIKLLRDENRDQNVQISNLNGKIESQDERVHQMVAEKVDQKMKEYDHHPPAGVVHRQKRPYRLIPIIRDNAEPNNDQQQQPHFRRFYDQPTNCSDLTLLGHTLNGFYVVKTEGEPTRHEVIFCSFKQLGATSINPLGIEKRIGPLAVELNTLKSNSGIHFHAQRIKSGGLKKGARGIIPFDGIRLNLGNAFNGPKGIFTTPKSGIYQFILRVKVNLTPTSSIFSNYLFNLNLNETVIGSAMSSHYRDAHGMIEATLKLNPGDRIYVRVLNMTNENSPVDLELSKQETSFSGSILHLQ